MGEEELGQDHSLSRPVGIHEAMMRVMADLGAISKDQFNQFDKYKFRGIDDVYLAVKPILVKHGVRITPTVEEAIFSEFTTSKSAVMQLSRVQVSYRFNAPDGSNETVMVWGEGADRGDKGLSKAMSAAYKIAIFQTFCVPTDEGADSEGESPDLGAGRKKSTPRKKQEPPPQEPPMPPDGDMSGPQEPPASPPPQGRVVFDTKIGFGRFADQTWRWLSEGASGGGRYSWATALRDDIGSSPPDRWAAADKINHERLTKVLKIIDDREMSQNAG